MEHRINHIFKIRKGTEQANTDTVCEKCGQDFRQGGITICLDGWTEQLYICSKCLPTGKIPN